jgi:hypothetical protein
MSTEVNVRPCTSELSRERVDLNAVSAYAAATVEPMYPLERSLELVHVS